MASFLLNNERVEVDVSPDTPLLWVLRDSLSMMGTKFGCGAGLCGACSVLLDGNSTRSCVLPVSAVEGREITTIEGLGGDHPLQQAWVEHNVPQCGYCQSGQLISASALLAGNSNPSDADIDNAMSGNICRCGTYPKIKTAIKSAAKKTQATASFYDATASANGAGENSVGGAA